MEIKVNEKDYEILEETFSILKRTLSLGNEKNINEVSEISKNGLEIISNTLKFYENK